MEGKNSSTGSGVNARYLRPKKSVLLGELYDSQCKVRESRRFLKPIGPPFPILTKCVIDPNVARANLVKQRFGATETALQMMEHPDFFEGEMGSYAFARVSLRALGFTEPQTWTQLWMWGLSNDVLCPLAAAPALLSHFEGVAVGDGCRVLTRPLCIEDTWHYFYVSGNGPMLYAFPHHPATTFSVDMEIIIRIET